MLSQGFIVTYGTLTVKIEQVPPLLDMISDRYYKKLGILQSINTLSRGGTQ